MRRYTCAAIIKLRAMRDAGLRNYEIAQALGRTTSAIAATISRYDLHGERRCYHWQRWPPEQISALVKAYRNGKTRKAIADELGISIKSVGYQIEKLRKAGKLRRPCALRQRGKTGNLEIMKGCNQ